MCPSQTWYKCKKKWGHVKSNYNTDCEPCSYYSTVVIRRLSYSGTNLAPIHQYLCCPRGARWYRVSMEVHTSTYCCCHLHCYSFQVTLYRGPPSGLFVFGVDPFWTYWTFCNSTILNSFIFLFHVWRICLTLIYHIIYLFKPRSFVPSNSFVGSFHRFSLATRVISVAVGPCVLW